MRRILTPLLFGLIGAAILISLGVWQMQRLTWKEAILANIEARISGAPIELPTAPNPEDHRYAPVALTGEVGAEELFVLTSRKTIGPGYLVISPFTLPDGRTLLLDRGFIPNDARDAARHSGQASITGNINWPDDRTSSTPENDISGNLWFARDVAPMAEVLGADPLMVILSTTDTDLGTTPLAVDTGAIPNDHLNYAITWFSLAAIWLVMTGCLISRILRREA